jgi:hypothetical protein
LSGWNNAPRKRRTRSVGRWAAVVATAAVGWIGCGDQAPEAPASITVTPSATLVTSVAETVRYHATVRLPDGTVQFGAPVTWSSSDPAVATIDASSGFATTVSTGGTTITATVGSVSGGAALEVYVPLDVDYVTGQAYFGREQYVEYLAGDLPIVLSAPHGGYEEPGEIPDRTWGKIAQDRQTQEVARAMREALHDRFGGWPHVVLSHLHRVKLDPNREIGEAAQENPFAEWAWGEFHQFLEDAGDAVARQHGRGLYIDLHGHSHAIARLELGYLLSSDDLEQTDQVLVGAVYITKSSLRTLAEECDSSFVALLRGPSSLGGLLVQRGFPAVPSPAAPDPGGADYFSGGYDVRRHGSRDGGPVSAVQIEMHYEGVRDTESARATFAVELAGALETYFDVHFGQPLRGGATVAADSPGWRE